MAGSGLRFNFTDDVKALGLDVVCIIIKNMQNKVSDEKFEEIKKFELSKILSNLSETSIENNLILQGFRDLHKLVNREGKNNVSSPENLLNTLLDQKTTTLINLIVDIYNLVSMKTSLALGAHDIKKIAGNITLRLTDGSETFWPIGYSKPKAIGAGEYGYIDDSNEIICRLETRQCEKTKVTLDTTNCFYIIQGNKKTSREYIKSSVEELINLTTSFCGGEVIYL